MVGPDSQVTAAFAVGLSSAAGFATANALQHQAAGRVPESVEKALRVLAHLVRQRIWLIATAMSFSSMLLHGLALRLGSLALVQPLMLVGVVLAVPLRAALERKTPTTSELRAVCTTVAGLALFVVATNPAPSQTTTPYAVGAVFVGACLGIGLLALRLSTRETLGPRRQAAVLGAGAGLMFGATAGLLKAFGDAIASGLSPAGVAAIFGCLVIAGLLGVAMNQRAYQVAPLAFSMPLVNVVDILVAVLFGVIVFGESPANGTAFLVLQGIGLAVMTFGLRQISSLEPSSLPAGRVALREAWS